MQISKYVRDAGKWYIAVNGVLVSGCINEKLADAFIQTLRNLSPSELKELIE